MQKISKVIEELKFYIDYETLTVFEDCDEDFSEERKEKHKIILDELFEKFNVPGKVKTKCREIIEIVNLWGITNIAYGHFAKQMGWSKIEKVYNYNNIFLKLDNYYENAKLFHKNNPFFYDKSGLFWFWNTEEFFWEIVDETDVIIKIDTELQFGGQLVNNKVRNNYLEAFRQVGRVNTPKDAPKTWVQFKDKIFDIKTKKTFDASPEFLCCNPVPWKIGVNSNTPTIDKLFKEWCGEDYIKTLSEIIAYCCLVDYPIHLIFCLVGSGRNGKTQFQKIIQKFLGSNNISSTELDLLIDNRFESTKLFKKLVCVLGETNFGVMKKTSLLKKLSGGDLIGYEYKNKTPFDGVNYAKIIINSNALPLSLDTSDGFYRRWMIIDFSNEFPEGKDIVNTIPDEEYEALVKKVIELLPGLLNRGMLEKQGSIEERKNAYIMASNPFSFFLNTFCYRDQHIYIKSNELYNAYVKYLMFNKKRKISRKEFNNILSEEGLYSEKCSRGSESSWFIDTINIKVNWVDELKKTKMTKMTTSSLSLIEESTKVETGHFSHSNHSKNGVSMEKPILVEELVYNPQNIDEVLKFIKEKGEVNIEDLSISTELLDKLKETGQIFEHKPGMVKIL